MRDDQVRLSKVFLQSALESECFHHSIEGNRVGDIGSGSSSILKSEGEIVDLEERDEPRGRGLTNELVESRRPNGHEDISSSSSSRRNCTRDPFGVFERTDRVVAWLLVLLFVVRRKRDPSRILSS